MFLPSPSTWKMAKYSHNHIPKNMIDRPILQAKFMKTIYPYITGVFNYSSHGTAYLLTNNHS